MELKVDGVRPIVWKSFDRLAMLVAGAREIGDVMWLQPAYPARRRASSIAALSSRGSA